MGKVTPAALPKPRWVMPAQALASVCLLAALIAGVGQSRWNLPLLAILIAIAIASDIVGVESESLLKISGASLAIVLAAVLLGGAAAALVGTATILVGWLRWREDGHYLRNNLLAFAAFPFIVGAAFQAAIKALGLSAHRPELYALIVVAYMSAVALNFWIVVGYQCLIDGRSLLGETQRMFKLLVTSELVCAVLTAGIAWLWITVGAVAVALVAIALVAYQHVVAQLLVSRERAQQLRIQAITDALTGLPNRTEFIEHTQRVLVGAQARNEPVGVMLMDLDGFKQVNDALGHHMGDLLLTGVAARLCEVVGSAGMVARLSGDEFAVLIDEDATDHRLLERARTITAALEQPFEVSQLALEISASIGIARFPRDGEDANALLKTADVAMYVAKEGGTEIELYNRETDHHSTRRLALTADLRAGIAGGQIHLEYQPEVDIATGHLGGAEALARWQHPSLGRIPPVEFVELAEQTGLIRPLTEQVLDLALEQLRTWQAHGLNLRLAVNLSARLLSDRRLPDQITSQLNNAGIDPDRLALEITETMVLRDPARAVATLTQLHAQGIGLSIDDFGTGYSSLAYLRELPVDEIKVDRRFVSRMAHDATDAVIVRSTVELGRSLQLRTVAEGVEDAGTLQRLLRIRCDIAQGFHFTRPLRGDALLTWARAHEAANVAPAAPPNGEPSPLAGGRPHVPGAAAIAGVAQTR